MKRSTKLALSLVLAAGTVVPAIAQDNFPDVPANHWAYEALARMKRDGLLVGYPDGLFRGGRPATRYELAVAMHAVYTNLKNTTDALQAQLDAMKGGNGNPSGLQDQINQLQQQINALKGYGDDIAALKRATEQFDRELRSLGVDVEAMKRDLGDLADRVTKLEQRKPPIDISGDVNLWVGMGNSRDDLTGETVDGRLTGLKTTGDLAGLTQDITVLHEIGITFAGNNTTGPQYKGTVVIGNTFGGDPSATNVSGGPFGSYSSLPSGRYSEGASDIWVNDLSVKFNAAIVGLAFNAEVGRIGYKASPYSFQRPDFTSYYSNERWDNGLYYLDGAVLGFNFAGIKVDTFAGLNTRRYTVNAIDLNAPAIGNNLTPGRVNAGANFFGTLDRTLGAKASIPIGNRGNITGEILAFENDADTVGGAQFQANRMFVYGGEAEYNIGRIKLSGGYHKADLNQNSDSIETHDNQQWNAKLGFNGNGYGLEGEYRVVESNYFAPGDWGRLGVLRNPGNIEGARFAGFLDITRAFRLSASGEFDSGYRNDARSYFSEDTDINSYQVRLDFKLNPNLSVFGSYEWTRFDNTTIQPNNDNVFQWTTFGLGYGLSPNAKLNIQYQFSEVKSDPFSVQPGGFPIPGGYNSGDHRGGFLTTQLSVKF